MDTSHSMRLLLRQIQDIQAQADRVLNGDNGSESLENFSRYCSELKTFISSHIEQNSIREYAANLPDINYQRNEIKLWHYLFLPSLWIGLYRDYHARNKTLQEIATARGVYASLELLVKGL